MCKENNNRTSDCPCCGSKGTGYLKMFCSECLSDFWPENISIGNGEQPIGFIDVGDLRELSNGNERQYSLFASDKGRMIAIYAAPIDAKTIRAELMKLVMDVCEAEYKLYDEMVEQDDAGHEESCALIHLMRKLEKLK